MADHDSASLHNNAGRVPYVKGIPCARDVQQHGAVVEEARPE